MHSFPPRPRTVYGTALRGRASAIYVRTSRSATKRLSFTSCAVMAVMSVRFWEDPFIERQEITVPSTHSNQVPHAVCMIVAAIAGVSCDVRGSREQASNHRHERAIGICRWVVRITLNYLLSRGLHVLGVLFGAALFFGGAIRWCVAILFSFPWSG